MIWTRLLIWSPSNNRKNFRVIELKVRGLAQTLRSKRVSSYRRRLEPESSTALSWATSTRTKAHVYETLNTEIFEKIGAR